LPNYPAGKFQNRREPGAEWWGDQTQDYRETGDPSVIYHDGAWYLFPSCGMAWRSEDFVNWTYHPTGPEHIGYAPTVVKCHDKFLLTAQTDTIWEAPHPLGPWVELGCVKDVEGSPTQWWDPMLFVDEGVLYCYYFLGQPNSGIFVVQMRGDDRTRFAIEPVHCFAYEPEHVWERYGDQNQNPYESWIEGPWMNKIGDRYFLQYSGCGAQWKNYAVGCYIGDHPLGPFTYQSRNPILRHMHGMINGCGHHCLVEGPNSTLWSFYTTLVKIEHDFERRIGMDPAGLDDNGNLYINGPTETPQFGPGVLAHPERCNDAGLFNLTGGQHTTASSYMPGRSPSYATDDNIRTWWEAKGVKDEWLMVDITNVYHNDPARDRQSFLVSAARTMFADRGLDYQSGIIPAPYKYRIEGTLDGNNWFILCNKSRNSIEQHISYDTWDPIPVNRIRIVVESIPEGMRLGLWEFTAFGRANILEGEQ
jgi:hypothetical protein